jgi:hypothetical protein
MSTQLGVVAHTVIPALRRLRQEDFRIEASLSYIARSCLKKPALVHLQQRPEHRTRRWGRTGELEKRNSPLRGV